ncbi:MAG: 3-phosphoglycerate dehydrogenase family protein [Eubacteriales bacterium]|nr:3-phosphoglycerate dehydrogenase family protein [Eubacteriales bacterium]
MYNVLTLNSISEVGLNKLNPKKYVIGNEIADPDGIILRSYDMHQMELPETLAAVARAGAGTNNIPIDKCSEKGIVVFNTPGANANAVKELVLTGIFLSSRKIVAGIEWAKELKGKENVDKLVEKGKGQFTGPEIMGKKLGVIGLGAIGVLVANAAISLGMEVYGYDPFLSVDAAWSLSSKVKRAGTREELVAECDYITIHVPLNDNTRGMYNKELFEITKPGARLLNFARGGIVDTAALKEAIDKGIITEYITDFPDAEVIEFDNVICIPHLGASTPESEENCAEMAALELKQYLEYGNIKNSVNFPACSIPYTGKARLAILHRNIKGMVGAVANAISDEGLNIDNMVNNNKGEYAYTLIDLDTFDGKQDDIAAKLAKVEGILKVRIVKVA